MTTVRQTERGDPGLGLDCSSFLCSGIPLRGHLGSRNPAGKLALSGCQGLWGTHWTRGVWGDVVSSRPGPQLVSVRATRTAGGEPPLSGAPVPGAVLILGGYSEVPGGLQGPLKNGEISDFRMF